MQGHLASVWPESVFPQVDALPRTEREAPVREWNRKLHSGQRRADVGRHVIGALVAMLEERVAIGYKAGEETLEISAHVGIDILLHDEARGRVAKKKRQQTAFHAGLGCPIGDWTSDLDQAATGGVEAQRSVGLAKHRQRINQGGRHGLALMPKHGRLRPTDDSTVLYAPRRPGYRMTVIAFQLPARCTRKNPVGGISL
jgi:hypothetical protein